MGDTGHSPRSIPSKLQVAPLFSPSHPKFSLSYSQESRGSNKLLHPVQEPAEFQSWVSLLSCMGLTRDGSEKGIITDTLDWRGAQSSCHHFLAQKHKSKCPIFCVLPVPAMREMWKLSRRDHVNFVNRKLSLVAVLFKSARRQMWLWIWWVLSLSLLQEGMPQTLSSTSMFTPCGFSPHLHTSKEGEQGGLIFQDGNLTSASLDALIQHLIPTTDYYLEVSNSQYNKWFNFDELGQLFMQKCKCVKFWIKRANLKPAYN